MSKSYTLLLDRIKSIRHEKKLSQKEMAQKLNISHSAYNKIENEDIILSIERLNEICTILDLNIFEVLKYMFDDKNQNEYISHIESARYWLSITESLIHTHGEKMHSILIDKHQNHDEFNLKVNDLANSYKTLLDTIETFKTVLRSDGENSKVFWDTFNSGAKK